MTTNAVMMDVSGTPVVAHHGDPRVEYDALHRGAALFDRSHRARTIITGEKGPELLTGLVTNDVIGLAPGHGQYAAALTAKGKIVADVRIFRRPDGDLLVDVPPRAAAGWRDLIRKFINPRIARYRDASDELRALGVYGIRAQGVVSHATGLPASQLDALPPYGVVTTDVDGVPALLVRAPDLALDGWELLVPADGWEQVRERLRAEGGTPAGLEAWEIARVEAGRPEWGLDIDENTIPQEANFDELHAISYTKGCYTGQETVARVHFRGHVNRHLRHLRHEGDEALPTGAALMDGERQVGDVRSSVVSPNRGPIALAMVRREVEPGREVRAVWEGGERIVTVAALPYTNREA